MSIKARNAHFTNWAKVIAALADKGVTDESTARAFLANSENNPFYYMVCFIKESQEIYTHGQFYKCSPSESGGIYTFNYSQGFPIYADASIEGIMTLEEYDSLAKADVWRINASDNSGWLQLDLVNNENPESALAAMKIFGTTQLMWVIFKGDTHAEWTWTVSSIKDDKQILVETTNSGLISLMDSDSLIPGAWYRITDYNCYTKQTNTQSANHPFDILVQAIDCCTVSDNAQAIQHKGDTYFSNNNLKAWKLKYSVDNISTISSWGAASARNQIWKCNWGLLESTPNNNDSSNYETAQINGTTKYLYRPSIKNSYLEGMQFYKETVIGNITSPDQLVYEADSIPYYDGDSSYEYPSEIYVKTQNGKEVATLVLDTENYYVDSRDDSYNLISFSDSYTENNGVYHLVPEDSDAWWTNFIGGSIADTEMEPYNGSIDGFYYAFDAKLPKQTKSVIELSDKVYIYKLLDGSSIDTVKYRSYAAPSNSKGTIYEMEDEFGNKCQYDFKNIQFFVDGAYHYTFDGYGKDNSLNKACKNNHLINEGTSLLFTVFKSTASNNKLKGVSQSGPYIFYGASSDNNIVTTSSSASIIAKKGFDANTMLIKDVVTTNGVFSSNHVQYLSIKTTINGDMYACQIDTMKRGTVELVLNLGRIQQCTIYGCGTLSVKNSSGNNTGCITYSNINLGMNGSNIKLLSNVTTSLENRIEGLKIDALNWGTTEEVVDITNHPVNATYPLHIAKNSSGNVKVWCDADLIQ